MPPYLMLHIYTHVVCFWNCIRALRSRSFLHLTKTNFKRQQTRTMNWFNCIPRNVGGTVPPRSNSKRKFGHSNLLNALWNNTHHKRYGFFHVLPSLRDIYCSNTTVIRSSVVSCIFAQAPTTRTYVVAGICFELFINGVSKYGVIVRSEYQVIVTLVADTSSRVNYSVEYMVSTVPHIFRVIMSCERTANNGAYCICRLLAANDQLWVCFEDGIYGGGYGPSTRRRPSNRPSYVSYFLITQD